MKYYVRGLVGNSFLGEIELEHPPNVGDEIQVQDRTYVVADFCIGHRPIDEIYIEEAKGTQDFRDRQYSERLRRRHGYKS
jgi:hypothetical protein